METIVRTIVGAQLQTCQLLGKQLPDGVYRSLNELLDISKTVKPTATDMQILQYVTIGNGGHRMVVGTRSIAKPEPVQHSPRHTGLYNQLPFIMRLPASDLTPAERINYRLRTTIDVGGTKYVAYYAKKLDLSETAPVLELRTVKDGGATISTPFVNISSDLKPVPPDISSGGVLITTGDYIAATAKVPFTLSPDEVDEFLNVCNIIYGDDGYAMISEIGLCSGVDRVVSTLISGVATNITEAINVHIIGFINTFFAVKFTNDGINVLLDTGSVEPLLALSRA